MSGQPPLIVRATLLAFLVAVCVSQAALGQGRGPEAPAVPPQNPRNLPEVLEAPPRSAEAVGTFVKEISTSDASVQLRIGQGRLLTLQADLVTPDQQSPLVAVGDPSVIDFEVVGPRHLRIIGQRIGSTDLSIVTATNENYSFEVHVTADLEYLAARLSELFPDAYLNVSQLRDHVVLEGQARDTRQVAQIVRATEAFLLSVQSQQAVEVRGQGVTGAGVLPPVAEAPPAADAEDVGPPRAEVLPGGGTLNVEAEIPAPQVINLIRVPGPQQVLLKVQIAELNRTALREFGVSFLFQGSDFAVGSTIGPPLVGGENGTGNSLLGLLDPLAAQGSSTAFGVFDNGDVNFFVNALRRNQVLKILAEPNLVAMNGQEAHFLSGGEFPVPVPQAGLGGAGVITIEFRKFGVELAFVPYILDNDRIRLAVNPTVSSLDFATGVAIQGTVVPGLNTRTTSTVVELREGQSLAISGILQVETAGSTSRIPGLGDVPYIGPWFSNNSSRTQEKELLVMVTPQLVEPLSPEQIPPLPGATVCEPDDHEFYLKGRIESQHGGPYRATTAWAAPFHSVEHLRAAEAYYMSGAHGYSE